MATPSTNDTAQNRQSKVCVNNEFGPLRGILFHRPGIEIELMPPHASADALYTDLLSQPIAEKEYALFNGIFQRWKEVYPQGCDIFYIDTLLARALADTELRSKLVESSLESNNRHLADMLLQMDDDVLAKTLIEGYEDPEWDGNSNSRYLLEPLYNLFFTRDAASTLYETVLINSMSFHVRHREALIFKAIFESVLPAATMRAADIDPEARTEGGDITVAAHNTLCIGQSIRTNRKGIEFLANHYANTREEFNIVIQELPHSPESFIHLDMVFTMLGAHRCMILEPMLHKKGIFADKHTTLVTIRGGKISYTAVPNILEGLHRAGHDVEPLFCGGTDPWRQLREQWHSGANFFALDNERVIGYRRNTHTINVLNKAGFDILNAEDIISGKERMADHKSFVATFPASELPRAGGGARCMTMPFRRG